MANTNPQAVAFSNNYARRGADDVVSCYLTMKRIVEVWEGQNLAALIPNDSTVMGDGAGTGTDGRAPITNQQINILIANCNSLIGTLEANSNLMLNQFLQVHVNATPAVQ